MVDIVRLFIFPGLMAFAASSDFFTMTISNRLGLALVAGFIALALFNGMNLHDMLMHVGAAVMVLAISFVMFSTRLDRRRRRQVRCGYRTLARLRPFAGLPALCLDLRRHADDGNDLLPARAAAAGLAELDWVKRLYRADGGVPYGIALAAAALLVYPDTAWMHLG